MFEGLSNERGNVIAAQGATAASAPIETIVNNAIAYDVSIVDRDRMRRRRRPLRRFRNGYTFEPSNRTRGGYSSEPAEAKNASGRVAFLHAFSMLLSMLLLLSCSLSVADRGRTNLTQLILQERVVPVPCIIALNRFVKYGSFRYFFFSQYIQVDIKNVSE